MVDHSRSVSYSPPKGSNCIPNLCSPFFKFHPHKNSPSKKNKSFGKSKSNKDRDLQRLTSNNDVSKKLGTSKSHDLGLKKRDYKDEEDNISAVHNFRYSYELGISGHNTKCSSPRAGYSGGRSSIGSPFTSVSSLRRNPSTRQDTPVCPSPLYRSSSYKSMDNSASFRRSASRSASRKINNPPIMFSDSTGMLRLPTMEMDLECTLEELCFGCIKKIMVTRDVLAENGQIFQEDELLSVKVKPGWKTGTRVTFEGHGNNNERSGTCPSDVVFVIVEKEHTLFRRDGDDLELAIEISLVDALCGCTIPIPLLGGNELFLTIDEEIVHPGFQKIIDGQGMPRSVDRQDRGKLKVVFLVDFPPDLTDDQRLDILHILQDTD